MRRVLQLMALSLSAVPWGLCAVEPQKDVVIEHLPQVNRGGSPIVSSVDGWQVQTKNYTVRIDRQAVIYSLNVSGVEFMAPAVQIGRAWYLPPLFACQYQWHTKPYRLPVVTAVSDNTIRAEGDRWWLEYAFHPDAIDVAFDGTPEGNRSFTEGFIASEVVMNLSMSRAAVRARAWPWFWPVYARSPVSSVWPWHWSVLTGPYSVIPSGASLARPGQTPTPLRKRSASMIRPVLPTASMRP